MIAELQGNNITHCEGQDPEKRKDNGREREVQEGSEEEELVEVESSPKHSRGSLTGIK